MSLCGCDGGILGSVSGSGSDGGGGGCPSCPEVDRCGSCHRRRPLEGIRHDREVTISWLGGVCGGVTLVEGG